MLPDLHLLSTKNVKKLFAAQARELREVTNTKVSGDEIKSIELTLEQLSVELTGRTDLELSIRKPVNFAV
jgi:hypothetical protein